MAPLKGQYLLIIGGSSGMGFSTAKLALAAGANVAIASSSSNKVQDAVSRLGGPNGGGTSGQVSGHVVDLAGADPDAALERLFTDVTQGGRQPLDHIINTAGRGVPIPISEIDMASASNLARLPLFVPLLIGKLAPRFLNPGPNSSIIFTSGQVAEKPIPGYSVLAAFASAQHGLARNLAVDLAPIRVNVVAPGPTETEMWGDQRDVIKEIVVGQSLLGKTASPDEVAEAYIYLIKNTDATGSIVSSNGGVTLK
ncbi:short chain dehydrogenase/ reductase [Apiospora rasikravindrae]|uniref:Short chain dehydrogenase/ reductase n=1 Tax=Apiospora rasikravindrae TaxID=990691 RepID=A0ABR1SYZ4_9PEZI